MDRDLGALRLARHRRSQRHQPRPRRKRRRQRSRGRAGSRAACWRAQSFPVNILFAAVTGEEQSPARKRTPRRDDSPKRTETCWQWRPTTSSATRARRQGRKTIAISVFSARGWEPGEDARFLREPSRERGRGRDSGPDARTARGRCRSKRYVRGFSLTLTLRNDRFGRGGDHSSFLSAGFPSAVRFTEPGENWVHQHQDLRTENGKVYGDLPEFVDYRYLARVAQTAAAWVSASSRARRSRPLACA